MTSKTPPTSEKKDDDKVVFEWIQAELNDGERFKDRETSYDKTLRLMKANPLVPIGCFATTLCLVLGLHSFMGQRRHRSQMLMRGRVLAQGFTIAALISGIVYNGSSKSK